ncbi:MAG: CHAD domain-containing protein [Nitrososphaerales archaeon]
MAEYQRLTERMGRCLREYLGDPGRAHTRDLRASVRRFEAAVRVLPKRAREEKKMRRCRKRCRALLVATSRLRDVDVLTERFSGYPKDAMVDLVVANLGEERAEFVSGSTRAAWALFEHQPPVLSRRDLRSFGRRFEAVVDELDGEVQKGLESSVEDEARVEELHTLRKDCKKLRYTLELVPTGARASELVQVLQRWQDVLGEIRDLDVALDYLSRAKQTAGVRRAAAAERGLRHERYLAFVRMAGKDRPGGRRRRTDGERQRRAPGVAPPSTRPPPVPAPR